jgi:hypothetical protein
VPAGDAEHADREPAAAEVARSLAADGPNQGLLGALGRVDPSSRRQVVEDLQRRSGNAAVARMLAPAAPPAPAAPRQSLPAPEPLPLGDTALVRDGGPGEPVTERPIRATPGLGHGPPPGGHVSRTPALTPATPMIQRETKEEAWKRVEGDRLITQVKAGVAEWVTFRKQPRTGKTPLPGGGADTVIREFAEKFRLDPEAAALKATAIQKLGPKDLRYLEEMASIWGAAGFEGTDVVFGVTRSDPQHVYTLKTASSGSLDLAQKALKFVKLESFVEVKYANKFGWAWTKQVGLVGISLGVSAKISIQKPEIDTPFTPPKSSKGKDGTPKPGYKAPVQSFSVDLEGTAKADPVNRFWGMDDLEGAVTSVTGPGAKVEVAGVAGGQFRIGTAIVFHGQIPGELSFPELDGSLKTSIGRSIEKFNSDKKKMGESIKDASFEVNLISGGLAYAFVERKPESFDVKELKKKLVDDSDQWAGEISGFETGKAQMPAQGKGVLEDLSRKIEDRQKPIKEQAPELQELGVSLEKNFTLDFTLTGWASRIWKGAGDEAARKLNNDALSGARADQVANAVQQVFVGPKTVTATAMGGGATSGTRSGGWFPGADGKPEYDPGQKDTPMGEEESEERYKEEVARAKQEFPNPKDLKVRLKQIEERFGRSSNEGAIRKVDIAVAWTGKKVEYESGGFGTPPELPAP